VRLDHSHCEQREDTETVQRVVLGQTSGHHTDNPTDNPTDTATNTTGPAQTSYPDGRTNMNATNETGTTAAPSRVKAGSKFGLPVAMTAWRTASNKPTPTSRAHSHDHRLAVLTRTSPCLAAVGGPHRARRMPGRCPWHTPGMIEAALG